MRVDARKHPLTITVQDDGTGFDVASRSQAEGHFGIRGMEERARQIGASCEIKTARGAGTTVVLQLPVLPETPAGLGNGSPPVPLHSGGMIDMHPIRLLIVDDHRYFARRWPTPCGCADFTVVAQANSGSDAVRLWTTHRPDVTLMDISMEGVDGVAAVVDIRQVAPEARVLMLTSSNAAEDAGAALAAGAAGYITKSVGFVELMDAIRDVHAGGRPVAPTLAKRLEARGKSPLSPREMEVLELLRDGLSQDQIHRRLAIADRTVRVHVAAIKAKLGAASTAHCVTRGFELDILSRPPTVTTSR